MESEILIPRWPAPANVRAAITTRGGGVSLPPYESLNLAAHVGDDPVAVDQNRRLLRERLRLPAEPRWLTQVHGCAVADDSTFEPACTADAAFSRTAGEVCAVLTADCLPLLVCDRAGTQVAAIHAGWRGLVGGVIEATLARFDAQPAELLVWLGPAIGPDAFEVGDEVREMFLRAVPTPPVGAARGRDQGVEDRGRGPLLQDAFKPTRPGHWLADIYALARLRLDALGVGFVGGGESCTVSDPARFFSYRRDGITGRFASLIWLAGHENT